MHPLAVPLTSLWLPVLLAAAGVWIASAIGWMAINHHAKDQQPLPAEDRFLDALRAMKIPPGLYRFPWSATHAEAQTPEMQRKWKEGPTGLVHIWGPISMPRCMLLSFLVYLLASVLVAYVGAVALPAGSSFLHVLRVLGTVGILTYCVGGVPHGIWFQQPGRAMAMNFVDGVIYGLMTGAIFAILWPK